MLQAYSWTWWTAAEGPPRRRRRGDGLIAPMAAPGVRKRPREHAGMTTRRGHEEGHLARGADGGRSGGEAFWIKVSRIGEAQNPGPTPSRRGSGLYADPRKSSFVGARMAGDDGGVGAQGPSAEGGQQMWALRVATANTTAWGPLMRFLQSTSADVVLAQEHRLRGQAVAEASDWAHRRGWKSVWTEAKLASGGGNSAGVAIFARQHLGLSPPPWGDPEVVPAHAVAATVEAPGCRPTVATSVYLHDGVGPAAANRGILAAIGGRMQSLGHGPDAACAKHMGPAPFIVGGDFNMTPEEVDAMGLVQRINASVVAPSVARGTCRTARSGRVIDFFLVSAGLDQGIRDVVAGTSAVIKTHVPVFLNFRPHLTTLRALAIRTPPKLPIEKIYGPTRPLPDWSKVRRTTSEARRLARGGTPEAAQAAINGAYEDWARHAELELQEVTGHDLPKLGCRGGMPNLVWRTIVPEKLTRGKRSREADVGRRRVAQLRDMRRVAADAEAGHLQRARRMLDEIREELMETSNDAAGGQADEDLFDLGQDLARNIDHPRGGDQGDWAGWHGRAEAMATELNSELTAAEHGEMKEVRDAWRDWVAEGAAAGAKHAHKAVKLPTAWMPTVTDDPLTGVVTADPMKLLAGQRREYAKLWNARSGGRRRRYAPLHERDALPRLTPEMIRAASKASKLDTAQTYDGFHPRHFELLGDEPLHALADLYEAAESLGSWPDQMSLVTMPALPKPGGGYRLIGIFAATYRIWARARRPLADEWESRNERAYFAAGSDRSPTDAVWRQALRAEAATAGGGSTAAAILTDLEKFYEHLDHDLLIERARKHGFPTPLVRLAVAAYGGPRMIRMKEFVAEELHAERGVIAGCSLATTLTRVYTIDAYDELTLRCPAVRLDNYIDDNVLSAEGAPGEVAENLGQAAAALSEIVETQLQCRIARRKTKIIAADEKVGKRIQGMAARAIGGDIAASAPNLGTDYAAGKSRRRHGPQRTAAARLRQGLKRRGRLAKLAKAIGTRQATKVFVTGTLAGMTYGAEVHGITDAELAKIHRLAATTMRPTARGRSLHVLMAAYGAPTWRAGVGPIQQYVRAVWRATTRAGRSHVPDIPLTELRAAWDNLDQQMLVDCSPRSPSATPSRRRWDRVRGPMGAHLLSLHRIGWRMSTAFTIVDDLGVERQILDHAPSLWADMMRQAVVRQHERRAAAAIAKRDPDFDGRRICLDHLRPLMGTDKGKGRRRLDQWGRGIVRALACNAIWTNARAHEAGMEVDPMCTKCRKARDTVHHRLWWCDCDEVEQLRRQCVPDRIVQQARREGPSKQFFTTGIMPHPADVWPKPAQGPDINVVRYDGESPEGVQRLSGRFYIDGSCTTHVIPELRRAGFAVAVYNGEGNLVATINSPLWEGLPQTPQAAEYVAYAAAVQYVFGPTTIFGDCSNVIRQAKAAPSARIATSRRYSGIIRDTLRYPQRLSLVEDFVKVKAHVCPDTLQDPQLRQHAIGNGRADTMAKEAVGRHPQPAPAEASMLDTALADANVIATYAAKVLRLWPPLQAKAKATTVKRRVGAPKRQVPEEAQHDWQFFEGAWRCKRCLSCAVGAASDPSGTRGRCSGRGTDTRAEEAANRGHSVAIAEGDGMPVVFCLKCGAWTARRHRGTAKSCRGVPTPAGKQALYNIARGRHPWLPPGVRDAQRAALHSCASAAAAKRRRVHVDGRPSGRGQDPQTEAADDGDVTLAEREPLLDDDHGVDWEGPVQGERPPEVWQPAPWPDGDEEDVFGHGGSLDEVVQGAAASAAVATGRGDRKRELPQSSSPPPRARRHFSCRRGREGEDNRESDAEEQGNGASAAAAAAGRNGGQAEHAAACRGHRVQRDDQGSHSADRCERRRLEAPPERPQATTAERAVRACGKRVGHQGERRGLGGDVGAGSSVSSEVRPNPDPEGPLLSPPPHALRRRDARGHEPCRPGEALGSLVAPSAADRLAALRRRVQLRTTMGQASSSRPPAAGSGASRTSSISTATPTAVPPLRSGGGTPSADADARSQGSKQVPGTPAAGREIRGRIISPGPVGEDRDRRQLIARLKGTCGGSAGSDDRGAGCSDATLAQQRAHRATAVPAGAGPATVPPPRSARAELLRQLSRSRR